MQKTSTGARPVQAVARPQLAHELIVQSGKCIECKLCRKECRFLQKYGSPKHIADTYDPASARDQLMPFECSLCQLCAAVCPVKINPAAMFLEMRREAVDRGVQDFAD
ncbi:MAG: 4Fe-4S dicluster domain-containing protein, partial [Deltaproteobacteria bacterium]|nr:4Fe-4S dicluster domain-containing protein [Deltaproteobacteria bacterium]